MKNRVKLIARLFAVQLLVVTLLPGTMAHALEPTVVLGAAATYAVLAGTAIENVGATTITGNVGVAPGTSVTGFESVW
jgi:hypothetical protein